MLPSCSTCQAHKEECIYDPDHDGRKPPSREYVQSLLGRIKALETALAERQPEENGETPTSDYVDSQSPNTAGSADASHRPKSARFKIVKNQVVAYGPTSSYVSRLRELLRLLFKRHLNYDCSCTLRERTAKATKNHIRTRTGQTIIH